MTHYTVNVYQDLDPLGSYQWFGYLSYDGHIHRNFGPFETEAQARVYGESVA